MLQSTRGRPVKLFQSASTEESVDNSAYDNLRSSAASAAAQQHGPAGSGAAKQPKQRWTMLFGQKNPQQNQLCEILNGYAKNGVPQTRSSYVHDFDNADLQSALEYLENMPGTWKEFVPTNGMPDNEIKIQSAIWELVTTEVDYIHALQTVTDVSTVYTFHRLH